jgi:hypothetical protein
MLTALRVRRGGCRTHTHTLLQFSYLLFQLDPSHLLRTLACPTSACGEELMDGLVHHGALSKVER